MDIRDFKHSILAGLFFGILLFPLFLTAQEGEESEDVSRMTFETRHQGTNARRTYTIDSVSVIRDGSTLVITGYHPSGRSDPEHQTMVVRVPDFAGRGTYTIANARARWQNLNSGDGYCSSLSGTMEVNAYEEGVIIEATFRFLCESRPSVGDPFNTIIDGEVVKGLEGKFLSPVEGDTLLPASEYSITWQLPGRGNFDLYYTLEKDPERAEAEVYLIEEDVDPSEGEILWIAPDTMSPYLWFLVVDRDGLSRHFFSDSMLLRSPRLARIRTDPEGPCPTCPYYESFDPGKHGWREVNGADSLFAPSVGRSPIYSGTDEINGNPFPSFFLEPPVEAEMEDYPDWPSWVDAFSVDASYVSAGNEGLIPRPDRVENWAAVKEPYEGGCFGMAVTAAYAFYYPERFSTRFPEAIGTVERAENLYVVKGDNVAVNTLTSRFHAYQFGRNYIFQDNYLGRRSTPMETVKWLREVMLDDEIEEEGERSPAVSIMDLGPDGGAHALLAYEVEEVEDDPEIRVYVYDPNYPGNQNAYISVNRDQNTWSYAPLGWSGSREFSAVDFVSHYHGNAEYFDAIEEADIRPILYTSRGTGIEARKDGGGSFVWSEAEGYSGSDQEAAPLYAIKGPGAPYGYFLGKSGYEIEATPSSRSDLRLSLHQHNLIFVYQSDAPVGESDHLRWEEKSMTIHNPGSTARELSFDITISGEQISRTITVSGFALAGGDSVRFAIDEDDMIIENYGGSTSYRVTLRQLDEEKGLLEGDYPPVDLDAGDGHHIDPPWWNLGTRLPIYVEDGDGGVRDTIIRINTLLGVDRENEPGEEMHLTNPLPDLGTLDLHLHRPGRLRVEAFDALGRTSGLLFEGDLLPGDQVVSFDTQALETGDYFLRVTLDGEVRGVLHAVRVR